MEAIIFIGLQGAGKSSFYKQRFFGTHVRISLDLLRTRNREKRFLDLALATGQPLVVDNTNPLRDERAVYIAKAKSCKYRIIGYYFQSRLDDCLRRNLGRPPSEQVPIGGLFSVHHKLELPSRTEGFDELCYVRLEQDRFVVENWRDEIQ